MNISEQNQQVSSGDLITKTPSETKGKIICGIKLKKNAKRRNLFAIFYIFFLVTTAGGYINVQIVYLLRDENYFNLEAEKIGSTVSNIIIISLIAATLWTLVAGYLFDMLGRLPPIFTSGIIMAVLVLVIPYCAPSILLLIVVRVFFAMSVA